MAWRNLWRQPMRTVLTLLSMTLASLILVFMLSFQLGVYDTMKGNVLRIFDGFAQFQPIGYRDDPDIKKVISDPAALEARAMAVQGITAAAPRATGFVILANGDRSYGAAVVGVDPGQEVAVSSLASTVHDGRYLQPDDTDTVVLGEALAQNLHLKVGDRLTLIGGGLDGSVAADSLEVVGLFHTGMAELDRQIAEMPLARFQETFAMGGAVNVVAVVGKSLADVDAALPALADLARADGLTTLDWSELQPALQQGIAIDFTTGLMFYFSLVIVVVFIILNTLLMSVLERTREFGMLLAIGMQPNRIGIMIWFELIFLTLLGNLAGIAIGGGLALWFQYTGISFSGIEGLLAQFGLPGKLYPTVSLTSTLSGPGVIFLSVVIAGIFPYRRIGRLEPIAAMGAA